MAYDAENLYFAFKCYDREPDKIKAALANRDTIRSDDFICINLDSFNDRQSLYAFYVNPLGIQTDSRYASGNEDFSVDFVWSSAGRLDRRRLHRRAGACRSRASATPGRSGWRCPSSSSAASRAGRSTAPIRPSTRPAAISS